MARTPFAELQEEIEKRRKAVGQAKEALDQTVERMKAKVVAAQQELDAFIAQVRSALGLKAPAKPGPKPKAPTKQGLDAFIAQVRGTLGPKAPKAADPPPQESSGPPPELSRAERVRLLYNEGKSVKEMAAALETTNQAIYQHLSTLRSKGLIQPREPASPPQPETASDGEPAPYVGAGGMSIPALREEVSRQQNGHRNKAVLLKTTVCQGHQHVVLVDRMGDGQTTPDDSGHSHKIYRFVASQTAGHGHQLCTQVAQVA
jgi:hypothetical protein